MEEKAPTGVSVTPTADEGHELHYASIGSRFVALILDSILLSLVTFPFMHGTGRNVISFVVSTVYYTLMIGYFGQTLGKKVMGIRVITEKGEQPGYDTALIRELSTYISAFVLGIGYIYAFFNPKKQAWHDLIAGTYVIESR